MLTIPTPGLVAVNRITRHPTGAVSLFLRQSQLVASEILTSSYSKGAGVKFPFQRLSLEAGWRINPRNSNFGSEQNQRRIPRITQVSGSGSGRFVCGESILRLLHAFASSGCFFRKCESRFIGGEYASSPTLKRLIQGIFWKSKGRLNVVPNFQSACCYEILYRCNIPAP